MKIKPLFDRVLVEPEDNKTKMGIVLPENMSDRPQTAVVVAVGSGIDLDNNKVGMVVQVGDRVVYNKFSAVEIKLDDKSYMMLRQIDIIGILTKD